MKKTRFSLLIMLYLISFILVACTPDQSIDIDEVLQAAQEQITLQGNVTNDITLPTTVDVDGMIVTVVWVSNQPNVISNAGIVVRPAHDVGNVSVILTATFTYEDEDLVATFTIVVEALPAPSYTVTFNSEGGSTVASQTIVHNQTATQPTAPIKAGYLFARWADADGNTFNFSTPITANLTLYAHYTLVTYNITYMYDEAAVVATQGDTTYTIETTAITLRTLTIENGTFIGWSESSQGTTVITSLLPSRLSNVTLYAVFEMDDMYDVTFDPTNDDEPIVITMYSGFVDPVEEPGKIGYQFEGWFTDLSSSTSFDFETTLIESDLTLFAKWSLIDYSITYNLNEGTLYNPNPATYTIETDTITLNNPTKPFYDFVGWMDNDTIITQIIKGRHGNLSLTAVFEETAYTITYELDGGTAQDALITTYTYNLETIILPNVLKDDYYFDGWYDDITEGNKVTEIPTNSFGDITLYAIFYPYVGVSFVEQQTVDIAKYYSIYFEDHYTYYAVDQMGNLYAKGSNALGFLGLGQQVEETEFWISIQHKLGLASGEYITHYYFEAPMIVLITSNHRVITWGFQGFELGEPVIYYEPTDITDLFEFDGAHIVEASHLFYHFVVITSDDRVLFYGVEVTDVTPELGINEYLSFAPLFFSGDFNYSNVIFTGERIFMHPIGTNPVIFDMTSNIDFIPGAEIIAVLSQIEGVHVITNTRYHYVRMHLDELGNPGYNNITLLSSIEIAEGETIVGSIAGGGLFTSHNRVLLPMYIVENEDDEMPSSVVFHDVTDELGLEIGETIVAYYQPLFLLTSNDRIIFIMPDDNFTTDPDQLPNVTAFPIDISQYLITGDESINVSFNMDGVKFEIGTFVYNLEFAQTGIELIPIRLELNAISEIQLIPAHLIQSFYVPEDRLYEAFVGWYIDIFLTELATMDNIYEGITLYPKWAATHFKITFEMGWEYEGPEYTPLYGLLGSVPNQVMNPYREHYDFNGWYYIDSEGYYKLFDFSMPLDQDVILYASFSQKNYEITLIFDLVDEQATTYAWAFSTLEDLYLNTPSGYSISGIFFDEAMTMPVPMDYEILAAYTFYVALEPETYDVYYYEQVESLNFSQIFVFSSNEYGITSDQRIFARGMNMFGSMGLDTDISYFAEFVELTELFNFEIGETIIIIEESNGVKVLYTSLGRVYMWGYYIEQAQYQSTPKEMTNLLPLNGEMIIDVYVGYDRIYFYSNTGMVYWLSTSDDQVTTYDLDMSFDQPMLIQRFGFDTSYLVLTESSIMVLTFDHMSGTVQMTDHSSMLNGATITNIYHNSYFGAGYLVFTSDGSILSVDVYDYEINVEESVVLMTHLNEHVTTVFTNNFDFILKTNLNNYYFKSSTETILVDTTNLLEGESIIGFSLYSGYYYSNLGNAYHINLMDYTFDLSYQFAVHNGTHDYIEVIYVNNRVLLYNSANQYIVEGENLTEATFNGGVDLVIETPVTGSEYTLRIPDPRPGLEFQGWYESIEWEIPAYDAPQSPKVLYAVWFYVIE